VLPALFLLRTIYRADRVEKEPAGLLIKLVLWGVISTIPAVWLEQLGIAVLDRVLTPGSAAHTIVMAFLVVAAVEEGVKYFFLKRATWDHPAFNYRFDGVVYAVFVSLGFAAWENIQYVFVYGLSVALPRAFLAVPGHTAFAVFMGAFYGRARIARADGNQAREKRELRMAYLTAVFFHGFYDACAMLNTTGAALVFMAFVAVMYIWVIRKVRHEAATDVPVTGFWHRF